MSTFDPSPDQQYVLDCIREWRSRDPQGDSQFLTLGGFAGTGKTTLIAQLAQEWAGVATLAVCGKAAHVLRSKGVDAQTVHSLLYVPVRTVGGGVRFRKRRALPDVQTLIVDEASMIDHVLFADLLSFGLPILFVGDHGQLEPIGTNPRLMANPDLRLELVHRQESDNPIVRLAMDFREGRPVQLWQDPKNRLRILNRDKFNGLISPDMQILCGYNRTRHRVNQRVREMLHFEDQLVAPGERLVCLQNNRKWGIFNGQQVTVLGINRESARVIEVEVEMDDGRSMMLPCLREQFGRDLVHKSSLKNVVYMDYGYALTAHKAQGSEWDRVLVLDEVDPRWDAARWRYTVTTRAKRQLIYCARASDLMAEPGPQADAGYRVGYQPVR